MLQLLQTGLCQTAAVLQDMLCNIKVAGSIPSRSIWCKICNARPAGIHTTSSSSSSSQQGLGVAAAAAAVTGSARVAPAGLQLVQCPLLNVSVCDIAVAATTYSNSSAAAAADGSSSMLAAAIAAGQDVEHASAGGSGGGGSSTQQQQQPLAQRRRQLLLSSSSQHHHLTKPGHNQASHTMGNTDTANRSQHSSSSREASGAVASAGTGAAAAAAAGVSLAAAGGVGDGVLVVVYNSLGWPRCEGVAVPLGHVVPGMRYTVQGGCIDNVLLVVMFWLGGGEGGLGLGGLATHSSSWVFPGGCVSTHSGPRCEGMGAYLRPVIPGVTYTVQGVTGMTSQL